MRVCVVPHRYPPDFGGVAVASQRYARGLSAAGHSVLVASLSSELAPATTELQGQDGIECLRIGAHRRTDDTLSAWFDSIVAAHQRQPFDVIIGRYLSHSAFVAVLAARFLGLPSVVSARGNDLDRAVFDPASFAPLLWSLSHASAVTAVSAELRQKITALVPESQPELAYNGVDGELFCPGPREPVPLGKHTEAAAPVLLFVGEARKKKGLPLLLEAFARCRVAWPEATLILLGGVRREDAPMLEFFSVKQPTARVVLVPALPQSELVRYYRLASVFVMPSLHDGLPNALLEAMACGCPIVASAVGGIPDAIAHGEQGTLVPAGSAEALSDAIADLLSRPARAAELGQRARLRAVSEFGLSAERARDLELLQRLVTTR